MGIHLFLIGQVKHLGDITQIITLTGPGSAYRKNRNIVVDHVGMLLFKALFRNDTRHEPALVQHCPAHLKGLQTRVPLKLGEIIAGATNDQFIPKCRQTAQKSDVILAKLIKATVCQNDTVSACNLGHVDSVSEDAPEQGPVSLRQTALIARAVPDCPPIVSNDRPKAPTDTDL